MSNFNILVKNNFNILLGTLQGKKNRKPVVVAFIILLLGIIGIYSLYFFQAYSMFVGLGKIGLNKLVLFHGVLTSLSVMIIIGVMRVSGKQKHNDTNLLLSLPIKKVDIILSKILNKYIFDLFFSILLFSPFLILFLIFEAFTIKTLVLGILFILLIPLLSVGISYILDFIISRVLNKTRYANFFKSIISTFIFILVMALLLLKTSFYGSVKIETLEEYFKNRPITNFLLNYLLNPNLLNIIITILIFVVPFIIGTILFYINYGKSFSSYSSRYTDIKLNKTNNEFFALLKKDFNYYISTPAYVTNTIIGPILILIVAILVCTTGINKINSLFFTNFNKTSIVFFISIVYCAFIALSSISCSLISLEGKNFWILKTNPINEKKLFLSKALLNYFIVLPFLTLSIIILSIYLKVNFIEFLILFLIPNFYTIVYSFLGLYVNICLPKLDFVEETQVIKQSMSTLITMILGIILAIIPFGIYKLLKLNILITSLISVGFYLVVLSIILIILFTYGIKKFRKI